MPETARAILDAASRMSESERVELIEELVATQEVRSGSSASDLDSARMWRYMREIIRGLRKRERASGVQDSLRAVEELRRMALPIDDVLTMKRQSVPAPDDLLP